MTVLGHTVPAWAPYAAAGLGAAALLTQFYVIVRLVRRTPAAKGADRTSRGDLLAAGIATAVSAEGMWETFGALGMPWPLRVGTFAFIEIMTIQCARRAARSMRKDYSPGADGIAMWVLTCLSAALSVSHEITASDTNGAVVLVRLAAPLVAAWGWERNMRLERRRRLRSRREGRIHWTLTLERVAVRLGIAEASERTTPQVDARRRIAKAAQAGKRLRTLQATGAGERRIRRAQARLDRAMQEAHEHAGLGRDSELQAELLAEAGALYNAAGFAALDVPAWWDARPPAEPVLDEADYETLAEVPQASDRLALAVQAYRDATKRAPRGPRPWPNVPSATMSTTPPDAQLTVVEEPVDESADPAPPDQDPDRANQDNRAGQDPLPDMATIVRTATDLGWSERRIEREYGITRHRIRTILGRPTSTTGDQASEAV